MKQLENKSKMVWQFGKKRKKIDGLQIGMEKLKLFLFADGIILYTKEAKAHTRAHTQTHKTIRTSKLVQ